MHNTLVNHTGDQPFERYNAAPSTQLAIFHQEGQHLHADMVRWGWRPHWEKDRAEPLVLQQGEPTEAFEWFKVDRAIGNVRNQGKDLLNPKRTSGRFSSAFGDLKHLLFLYFFISLFLYFVISSFRHFVISSFR